MREGTRLGVSLEFNDHAEWKDWQYPLATGPGESGGRAHQGEERYGALATFATIRIPLPGNASTGGGRGLFGRTKNISGSP